MNHKLEWKKKRRKYTQFSVIYSQIWAFCCLCFVEFDPVENWEREIDPLPKLDYTFNVQHSNVCDSVFFLVMTMCARILNISIGIYMVIFHCFIVLFSILFFVVVSFVLFVHLINIVDFIKRILFFIDNYSFVGTQ